MALPIFFHIAGDLRAIHPSIHPSIHPPVDSSHPSTHPPHPFTHPFRSCRAADRSLGQHRCCTQAGCPPSAGHSLRLARASWVSTLRRGCVDCTGDTLACTNVHGMRSWTQCGALSEWTPPGKPPAPHRTALLCKAIATLCPFYVLRNVTNCTVSDDIV